MAVNKETVIVDITAADKTQAALTSVKTGLTKISKATQAANTELDRSARQMRAGWQQAGYQIQDVAVQYQMGTSPFIIFAQQGSQIASIFGAGGAVAGALISIAGVIGMTLAPKIFSTTTALQDMETAIEEADKAFKDAEPGAVLLADAIMEMAKASSAAAAIELRRLRDNLKDGVQDAKKEFTSELGDFGAEIQAVLDDQAAMPGSTSSIWLTEKYGIAAKDLTMISATMSRAISGGNEDIDRFLKLLSALQNEGNVTDAFNEFAESAANYATVIINGGEQVQEYEDRLANLAFIITATGAASDKAGIKQQNAIENQIDALKKQFQTYGMGGTAVALYEARLAEANLEQQEQIALLAGGIELLDRKAQSDLDAAKAAEDRMKAEEKARELIQKETVALSDPVEQINAEYESRRSALIEALELEGQINAEHNALIIALEKARIDEVAKYEQEAADKQVQLMQARFQAAGQLAGALAGVLEEGTAAQRAALAVQKGLALAEAIMNMHRAIGGANAAPWPQNIPAIIQATSTGLSAIAGIKAASFEGGGFTGYGSRVGGLDGKGGMAAIVHPNETIIDHTKGGAATQVNITIQANDTRGFDELLMKRRGVIASMVQSSLNNVGRKI